VRSASVTIDGVRTAGIAAGLAILVGIKEDDDEVTVDRLADKVAALRIFEDDAGKMNLSTDDVGGSMLVVSQFTLYADVRKGRRPSFIGAARSEQGQRLYERFTSRLRARGYDVQQGVFGAKMLVAIENDGPVTIVIDSRDL
jgi:D-tyrosyl-tRNA(Tyr) deacylase